MDLFQGEPDQDLVLEFRAGKMSMQGKMVYADHRKGLVSVSQADDGMIYFAWKDRSTNQVEDELIIFPKEAEFKKVPQCTTGRVFLLQFREAERKYFFWMQEPKDVDDEFIFALMNYILSHGAPPDSEESSKKTL
uniref:Proteasomal ubiquitin receptor ADRM1 homolog n=2 Tax=Rhodnius prolixus TaxID=13249 RepID=T1HHB6_RHOPR